MMGQAVSKLPPGIVLVTGRSRGFWQNGITSTRNVLRRSNKLPSSCSSASFSSSYPGRRSGGGGSGSATTTTEEGQPKIISTASNPGNFLRGEGLAQDERDLAQEKYWKERHNLEDDTTKPATTTSSTTTTTTKQQQQQNEAKKLLRNRIHELPPDLLQFLKDAGPLQQTLDEEQTSPRVLKDVKEKEQRRMSRPLQRERKTMPLMGDDETFTAVRNTNFARTSSSAKKDQQRPPFGITGVQLYDLLSMQQQQQQQQTQKKSIKDTDNSGNTEVVEAFYQKHFGRASSGADNAATAHTATDTTDTSTTTNQQPVVVVLEDEWSAHEIQSHQQLLRHAMAAIELPILVQDAEGCYLGIAPHQRPGSEVTNIRYVPHDKVQLVLADWVQQQKDYQAYRAKVVEERKHRNPGQRTRTRTNPQDE